MKKIPVGLLVFLLSACITLCFFWPVLSHANCAFIVNYGDGLRHYYAYLYYLQFDDGMMSHAMNYPYGEHISYLGITPAFTFPLKQLAHLFPGITTHALGIFHVFLLSTIPLCSWYLFKILRAYTLPVSWAMVGALSITFMSPQLFKIFGHYGLALYCFYPMLQYYLLQYSKQKSWRYLVTIFVIITIAGFFHPYFFAFGAAALMLFGLLSFLLRQVHGKRTLWLLFMVAIVPILLFQLWLQQTDDVTDRPTHPNGILVNRTMPSDVFTNPIVPLGNFYDFLPGIDTVWIGEGYAYLGWVGVTFLIGWGLNILYRCIKSLRTKKWTSTATEQQQRIFLLISFLFLWMANGFPLNSERLGFIEHVDTLKQFRTIGRFAWGFYYFFLVFMMCQLCEWIQKWSVQYKQGNVLSSLFLSVLFFIYLWQVWGMYRFSKEQVLGHPHEKYKAFKKAGTDVNDLLLKHKLSSKNYQAILFFPFFHEGTDKILIKANSHCRLLAEGISLQTRLPLFNAHATRSSWSRAFNITALSAGYFIDKPLLDSLLDKPVLIVAAQHYPLYNGEQIWIDHATFIDSTAEVKLYSIVPKTLQVAEKQLYQSSIIQAKINSKTEGLLGSDSMLFYHSENFNETQNGTYTYNEATPNNAVLLLDSFAVKKPIGDLYEFSIWQYLPNDDYRMPVYYVQQFNAMQCLHTDTIDGSESRVAIDNWFCVRKDFKIAPDAQYLKVLVKNVHRVLQDAALDNLLIRPAYSIYFYKEANGQVKLNNHFKKNITLSQP